MKNKLVRPAPLRLRKLNSLQRKPAPVKLTWQGDMAEDIESVIAFDGGNGKACAGMVVGGKLHRVTIPHARTRVTGKRVKRVVGGEDVTVDFADFAGDRWGYGDAIWSLSGEQPIDVFQNTPERYGSEAHVFYALLLMAELGVPTGWEGWLVVSVPPGLYEQVAERTEAGFRHGSNGDGWWEITPGADGKLRRYRFLRVIVMMEGADATYGAYRFDFDGHAVLFQGRDGQDALGGRCMTLSAGFGTFDTPLLVDGELVDDNLHRTSDPNAGIGTMLCSPILERILDRVPTANLTNAHIDRYLRDYATGHNGELVPGYGKVAPWSEEAAIVQIQGQALHLKSVFDHYIGAYARFIWQSKIAPAIIQNIDVFICSGGGWLYMEEPVKIWCQERNIALLVPREVSHLKKFQYFEIEMVGLLTFIAALIRDAQ